MADKTYKIKLEDHITPKLKAMDNAFNKLKDTLDKINKKYPKLNVDVKIKVNMQIDSFEESLNITIK